tara:strand:- start:305 stop:472 length:168 start_codon:yes stop_codon:yes gene_type:complete
LFVLLIFFIVFIRFFRILLFQSLLILFLYNILGYFIGGGFLLEHIGSCLIDIEFV